MKTKPSMRLKEFPSVIKAGIFGALVLTGVCLLLIIFANIFSPQMPRIAHILATLMHNWPLGKFCLITACVGFILGALVVRRILPGVQKGVAPMALAAIPLIIGVWLLNDFATRVEVPQRMKLVDCTNSTSKIHFTAPQGRSYILTLDAPEARQKTNYIVTSSYLFSGNIRISSGGALITDFPINFDRKNLDKLIQQGSAFGFALTGSGQNTNTPRLDRFIKAQGDYDIEITFDPPPPALSSIWLHWRQSAKDR